MSRALEDIAAALERRFGADVSCAVVSVQGDPARLWSAERALVAAAVPARQREFAAGRACARQLLTRQGFEPAALLRAEDRAPLWPAGAIGSIAHDGQHCAVVVARAGRLCGLGLDIEPDESLEPALWPELFAPRELAALAACEPQARGRMARVLFSAKECVYKATHGFVDDTPGFHEVEIALAPRGETFRARLHHPAAAALAGVALTGFHVTCSGSILTGLSLAFPSVHQVWRSAAADQPVVTNARRAAAARGLDP
jgi:4'-phosphopantetheinyl transferase EntD